MGFRGLGSRGSGFWKFRALGGCGFRGFPKVCASGLNFVYIQEPPFHLLRQLRSPSLGVGRVKRKVVARQVPATKNKQTKFGVANEVRGLAL